MRRFQKAENAPRLRDTLTRGIRKAENRISDCGLRIGRRVRFKATGARSIFTSPRWNCRAFTLIELLGVMAIIGILAAVMLPSMITRIEDANSVGEDAKLEEIARALVAGIKASGTIPNPNLTPFVVGGWGLIAENFTTLIDDTPDPGTLHYVFPEQDQSARRVYLNDQFMTYLVAATGGAVSGVFQTPASGWPAIAGGVTLANVPTRMYVVSGSKKDLFLNCGENQATTPPQPTPGYGAVLIGDLQNWVKKADGPTDPAPGAIKVPDSIAQWGDVYAGGGAYHTRGEFLHVKVVDLRPLFCQVTLVDTAAPENIAGFTVTTPGTGYPPSSTVNVSFGNNSLAFGTTPGDTYVDVPPPPVNGIYDIGEGFIDTPVFNGVYDLGENFTDGISNGIYDASDILNDNNGDGIYSLSGGILATTVPAFSKSADYNTRRGIPLNIAIPGGTASFTAPVSPNAPTYDLISTTAGSGGFAAQTISIYVIKGRSINLFNGTPALDKSVVIQSDVQYRYFNNSWTRVD